MTYLQTIPAAFAAPVPAPSSALTPEEWKLVMEALSAYQHHSAFRAVYEKLQASHEESDCAPARAAS